MEQSKWVCKAGADPTHDNVTNLSKMFFPKEYKMLRLCI